MGPTDFCLQNGAEIYVVHKRTGGCSTPALLSINFPFVLHVQQWNRMLEKLVGGCSLVKVGSASCLGKRMMKGHPVVITF